MLCVRFELRGERWLLLCTQLELTGHFSVPSQWLRNYICSFTLVFSRKGRIAEVFFSADIKGGPCWWHKEMEESCLAVWEDLFSQEGACLELRCAPVLKAHTKQPLGLAILGHERSVAEWGDR